MIIREIRAEAARVLRAAVSAIGKPVTLTPSLDSDCLLAWVLRKNRAWLLAHDDVALTPGEKQQFESCLRRRLAGLPLAYITVYKEFFGYNFAVTPDVLIPKPDTELLVERALFFAEKCCARLPHEQLQFADVCTGSGCVAISVLAALFQTHVDQSRFAEVLPRLTFFATDISFSALSIAKKNADALLDNAVRNHMVFLQSDLLDMLDCGRHDKKSLFDVIMSNPPYVPSDVADMLLADGRSEPRLALDGDENGSVDGLGIIRRLIPQVWLHLKKDGWFLLETGEYNAAAAAELLEKQGFADVQIFADMAGLPRVIQGRHP